MFAATLAVTGTCGIAAVPGHGQATSAGAGLRCAALCCDGCTLSSRCHGERRQVASGVEEGAGCRCETCRTHSTMVHWSLRCLCKKMKRLNTAPILQIEIARSMLRFWSVIWVLNGWSILVPAMGPFKVAANYVIYISMVFCVHKYIICDI